MKKTANILLLVVLVLVICVAGCGKKETSPNTPGQDNPTDTGSGTAAAMGVDISKPIADIKAMLSKLDAEQVKATAVKYKDAIVAKQSQVGDLTAKIKEIPIAQMAGEEMKELKAEMDELTKTTTALKDRFDVYLEKLKELKVDISDLKL
ncbi:MAG: hypothetical protein KAS23_07755 [Anaerohalosphaera sp.]|nr:hypothetical protein [Anaerohalosphaera sp.]